MSLKQISLVKGSEKYIFRYRSGEEVSVIDAFIELADNAESSFDWFDAAVLSYQMGKQIEYELDGITHQ